MADHEELVFKAKLAEQAERYDEMVEFMKSLVSLKGELQIEERNLLSVAYKNVIGARRASWRVLSSLEKTQNDKAKTEIIQKSRENVEQELKDICKDILGLLEESLIANAKDTESKVFYQKMKGDYWRYQAEFLIPEDKKSQGANSEEANKSLEAYNEAQQAAEELPATHPIRLGLALNFSVFYYEIKVDSVKACELAKKAFDEAIGELESKNPEKEDFKDSTLIMQLLRDNLTLWTSENEAEMELQDVDDKD